MVIVSSNSQVIWFPHYGNLVMIYQLDYFMLEIVNMSNVPFIRNDVNEDHNIRVGSSKNDSLIGNFMILQPLSIVEVAYQANQMDSENLDQNIPLMEEYDPVTWPILVVSSHSSLDFLYGILSSNETILEIINIWLYPPKDIFCGATRIILGLNLHKYKTILCMFLDLIMYIWKHEYRLSLSLYEYAFENFATQT